MSKPTTLNYEPCPVCTKGRFKGCPLPICTICSTFVARQGFLNLRHDLVTRNSPLDVMIPFDRALIEDCKETLKRKQFKAQSKAQRHE